MTSLTFYGGVNEIGGNKILLEDKKAKIFLDFGQSFTFGEGYFYDFLAPRTTNGLEAYFEFNMLPKIPKLYNSKMLELTDLKYQKPNIDAILITHAHSDHYGHLQFVDESIPVYLGECAHTIMESAKKVYPGFGNYGVHNTIKTFKTGHNIQIKHLNIEPVHVDHSVPGAYGFIIHTPEGAIAYTGDLRMHGPKSDMTEDFIRKAKKASPIALICEGTRVYDDKQSQEDEMPKSATEKEVSDKMNAYMDEAKGLVIGNFTVRNFDRFMSFYNAARKHNRTIVIDLRTAYQLRAIKCHVDAPDVMEDPHIKVYYRICKSGKFVEKDYAPWEREFFDKKVTYKDLVRNQGKYAMMMTFFGLMELIYIRPKKDSVFIYSSSEHFLEGEDNKEMRDVLYNWMKHFSLKLVKAHASGHANMDDIKRLVKDVKADLVIPVHTQNQEMFRDFHSNVKLPVWGKKLSL